MSGMALSGVDGSTGWTGGLVCIIYIYKSIHELQPEKNTAILTMVRCCMSSKPIIWLSSWPIAKNESLGLNP